MCGCTRWRHDPLKRWSRGAKPCSHSRTPNTIFQPFSQGIHPAHTDSHDERNTTPQNALSYTSSAHSRCPVICCAPCVSTNAAGSAVEPRVAREHSCITTILSDQPMHSRSLCLKRPVASRHAPDCGTVPPPPCQPGGGSSLALQTPPPLAAAGTPRCRRHPSMA